MRAIAFDEVVAGRAPSLPLSESEKAMLFDLALAATGRESGRAEALQVAPVIDAFARAYVAIRDREEGLV
ncbi:MAG: hypothetical protein IV086_13550 [Hyphomonadaceae bacterium]|nr:MAG: hypothetical protein FD160_1930 [Caulobacteraceae bacterium]MBT9446720.1 hypothetical protein [Hyphomonadaceae bacterium]TPW06771.1 MAG: hypothetical protein FD124_1571 [Alphaproteobacteria bacterium]